MLQNTATKSAPRPGIDLAGSEMAGAGEISQLRDYDLIRNAIAFVTEYRGGNPWLDRLAAELGLSRAHCGQLFKRWCGLSATQFVQAIAVDYRHSLLKGEALAFASGQRAGPLSAACPQAHILVSHEKVTAGGRRHRGEGMEISYGFHASPFGLALVMATLRGVVGLAFCDGVEHSGPRSQQARAAVLADMTGRWPGAGFAHMPAHTEPQARQIFDPQNWRKDRPLRLVLIGTDFEFKVWQALAKLPSGLAVSYQQLALHLGLPGGARAVGSAVGRNPVSFVVPCHRVLRGDGGLGGYHWGLTRKRAILAWEAGLLAGSGAAM